MDGIESWGNSKLMTAYTLLVLLSFFNIVCGIQPRVKQSDNVPVKVVHLSKDFSEEKVTLTSPDDFRIFCFAGVQRNLSVAFHTAFFRLHNLRVEEFETYKGYTPKDVYDEYEKNKFSWFNFPWQSEKIRIPVFNRSCVGVSASKNYSIRLEIIDVDYWKVVLLGLGTCLFILAPLLSRNTLFHYACGIAFGLSASLLILIFVMSRFIPRKAGAMSLLIGGWAFILYLVHHTWESIELFLQEHKHYITAYIVTVSLISFAICYRFGPVSDLRTIKLIQFAIQGIGLLAIFFSSEWQLLSGAMAICVFLAFIFPKNYLLKFKTYCAGRFVRAWRIKFPPKITLLKEEEYYEQGLIETRRALEQLRRHCESPDCNPWKTIAKLKSPSRFASFMAGSPHLSDDEVLEHESFRESFWDFSEDE